jgi:hypothetical protein
VWRCPLCGLGNAPHIDNRCAGCGLNTADAHRSLRRRRVAVIVIGVALQMLMGLLLWLLPPGTILGWLIYIGLGAVGALHIIAGAVGLSSEQADDRLAITAAFEPDDLPYHAKLCPSCREPLADAIERGRRRCPACDSPFNMRQLGWRQADPAGEPATLAPNEMRIGGGVLVALVVGAIALVIIAGLWSAGALP